MHSNLWQLAELWRNHFPERAVGGEAAMLGFRYQSVVALRDMVRAFLDGHVGEVSVFAEMVSDICERTDNGEVVFTQVKRIGRTVTSALEELWSIHQLAAVELPELAPRLRYRVLCSQWRLRDVEGAVVRWQPIASADASQVELFKTRVTWTTDPNPFDELLALVANELNADEPLPTVLSWIGRLSDPASGSQQVWSDLHALRNRQRGSPRSRMYVWTSEDRPPRTVQPGQVLTNEQPKIVHLRRGYFSDRPLFHSLAEDAIKWTSSNPREADPALRVPVLWLAGRSGCGKSVALLHVLSQLHQEGVGPILWLGNSINLLPEAIRRAASISAPNDQVIIAVDDPYAPRTQGDGEPWREALAELNQLENRAVARLPLLICCGPTEQAHQLEHDFADDVRVHTLKVPHSLTDRAAIESWFQLRTGAPPPDVGSGDLLPAQLFFEWQTGQPLGAFAISFRKRLEEQDPSGRIRDTVFRAVAVNRLYSGYPAAALDADLSPEQKDSFAGLLSEHHFAVDEDPERLGLWLAHPHLADALFEAWLPSSTKSNQRQAVITTAFVQQLRYGSTPQEQTATLWAISRLAGMDPLVRGRLQADDIGGLLADVYLTWRRERNGPLSFAHLPVWISLQIAFPESRLRPDLVDEALARLRPENKEQTGFRLTCHLLLKYQKQLTPEQRAGLTQRLARLLGQTSGWREWPFVAADAVWRVESEELCRLVELWLATNEERAGAMLSWLWLRWDLGPNAQWLLRSTVQWLGEHIEDPSAGPVLSAVLRRRDLGQIKTSVATLALDWLQHCMASSQAERVLMRLLGLPTSEVVTRRTVRLVLDYLEARDGQQSSFLVGAILRPRVIEKVSTSVTGGQTLAQRAITLGLEWVARCHDDPGMPYVADRLLRLPALTDAHWSRVASLSLARLRHEPRRRDADFTLLSIARRRQLLLGADPQLFSSLIRSWLDGAIEDVDRLLSRGLFVAVAKQLAPALPLAAQFGDSGLREELEKRATRLRSAADDRVREEFDRAIWRLFKSLAWPSRSEGKGTMGRIGLLREESRLLAKLSELVFRKASEMDVSPVEVVSAALNASEEALNDGDWTLAGRLLAKTHPVAARLGEPYVAGAETLTQRLISSPLPVGAKCGFLLECDRLIEKGAWDNAEDALRSFDRLRLETPLVLGHWGLADGSPDSDRVSKVLDFADELFESTPVRVGLFLPALLSVADRSRDPVLIDRCRRLIVRFVESANVSDGIKAGFADRIRATVGSTVPTSLRPTIENLGLEAPWIAEQARAAAAPGESELMRYLRQAEQLVARGSPGRSGMVLAPLLVLAGRSGRPDILQQVCHVAAQMLAHPRLAPEERDGFASQCRSYQWAERTIQEQVFQTLGIGAPLLERLLFDQDAVVSSGQLKSGLERAAEHLEAGRHRGAIHILVPGLPLASRTGDDAVLEEAVKLAVRLLADSGTPPRLRESFAKACADLARKGCWQSPEVGRQCLGRIGIALPDTPASAEVARARIVVEPSDLEAWRLLAASSGQANVQSEAAVFAVEVIRDDVTAGEGAFLFVSEIRSRNPGAAQVVLEAMTQARPEIAKYWTMLSVVRRDLRLFDGSLEASSRATALDPSEPTHWYALGRTHEVLGTWDQAEAAFKEALRLRRGDYPKAQKALRRILALRGPQD